MPLTNVTIAAGGHVMLFIYTPSTNGAGTAGLLQRFQPSLPGPGDICDSDAMGGLVMLCGMGYNSTGYRSAGPRMFNFVYTYTVLSNPPPPALPPTKTPLPPLSPRPPPPSPSPPPPPPSPLPSPPPPPPVPPVPPSNLAWALDTTAAASPGTSGGVATTGSTTFTAWRMNNTLTGSLTVTSVQFVPWTGTDASAYAGVLWWAAGAQTPPTLSGLPPAGWVAVPFVGTSIPAAFIPILGMSTVTVVINVTAGVGLLRYAPALNTGAVCAAQPSGGLVVFCGFSNNGELLNELSF